MALCLTYPAGAALIAGGTGRVGEGCVRRFAQAGVPLVFTYNSNAAKAHALESELRAAGHRVHAVPMALTDGATRRWPGRWNWAAGACTPWSRPAGR